MPPNSRKVSNEHYTRKPGRRGKALTPERSFEIARTKGTDIELAEKFDCSIATVKNARGLANLWRAVLKYQQIH